MFLLHQLDLTLKKLRGQVANAITLLNLSFGCLAIFSIIEGQLRLAVLLIFIAAFSDRLDGIVARKFKIESEIGKQLDSFSDIISFGVAPGVLLYTGILHEFNAAGIIFTIIYIICGAIRLAKYNITEYKSYFVGLPITVAGTLLTLSYLATQALPPYLYMFFTIILAFLMISPFKIKKI